MHNIKNYRVSWFLVNKIKIIWQEKKQKTGIIPAIYDVKTLFLIHLCSLIKINKYIPVGNVLDQFHLGSSR